MSNADVDVSDMNQDDPRREEYVVQRLRTRRKMALVAFAQFVFLGAGIAIGGLLVPGWADRIDHMGTFLSIYFTTLAGVVSMYWGLGAYERNSFSTFSGSGGFSSTTERVPLVKTPHAAG